MRSIVAHWDHFDWRLSVCLSGSHSFLVVMLSLVTHSNVLLATRTFLGMRQFWFIFINYEMHLSLLQILGQSYSYKEDKTYTTKDNTLHRAVKFTKEESGCGHKACTYCRTHGIKTNRGRTCETTRKCDLCDVPLCCNFRDCWIKYHTEFDQNIIASLLK